MKDQKIEALEEKIQDAQEQQSERFQEALDNANKHLIPKMVLSPYFQKRVQRLNKQIKADLVETSKRKYEVADQYGVYKQGTFTHKAAIVEIGKESGLWYLHIYSEQPVTLPIIEEIRYKYLPNELVMALLFPERGLKTDGVLLYEVPRNTNQE